MTSVTRRGFRRLLSGVLLAGVLPVTVPASSPAAVLTFGSPLSVPATLNTTENLGYYGTFTPVPPNPEAPNGLFHTNHWGADTALWNATIAGGQASAPVTGQAVKVRLEGCAKPASGGPPPLTQIHFQDISPLTGGGARVKLTSQPFDIPVCGHGGASGSTVTTYEPINLCVAQGDYVAFNDNGGYVPYIYRSGVPYQVIGAVAGSTMDSFIGGNRTGNGSTLSAHDSTANDGFASNPNEELMLQVTLGSGPNATHICPGGTGGLPPPLPPLWVGPQTDGVNHSRIVAVAAYCRPESGCSVHATLRPSGELSGYGNRGGHADYGHANVTLKGKTTNHLAIRLSSLVMAVIRRNHGLRSVLSLSMGATTVSRTITIKIF
jgi:hypothetical protein